MAISLTVNGTTRSVEAEPDTPLLYVLRNDFELNSPKFGCGRMGAFDLRFRAAKSHGSNEAKRLEGFADGSIHPAASLHSARGVSAKSA